MKDSLLLLSNFIKNPKQIGAVAPSSRFLTREIVGSIGKNSKNIVELGPGVGTFTKAILKKARLDAKLLCFEVNRNFCSHLKQSIVDERFEVINAGAEKIKENLKKFGIEKADCIVSGLPFRNFSEAKKSRILDEVETSLSGNGRFVLFQYTNGLNKMLDVRFANVKRKFISLNVPPAFVYVCEK